MEPSLRCPPPRYARSLRSLLPVVVGLLASLPAPASALPLFGRQTGQNCRACHAGGQFPELTPYGRLFKMTGYTIGQRTIPVAVMALGSYSRVSNTSKSADPAADFRKNGAPILATASLFLGGKVTENVGVFAQITYDPYAAQSPDGRFHGHSNADNIDVRYADRFIDARRDLIVGISLNNNPSVSDPWNTAPAWMQYVPVPTPASSRFVDGTAPYPGYASGSNVAGVTAYAYWNRTIYAELGGYRTANGLASFMSAGLDSASTTRLRGLNPYWRLAWTREWGAHNLMIGSGGMHAQIYDNPLDVSDPATTHRFTDWNVDTQYQYLLEPHSVTAQFVHARSRHRYPDFLAGQPAAFVDAAGNPLPDTNAVDTTRLVRAKFTYVYRARYGGSLSFFDLNGSTNTALQTSGFDPATGTITPDPAAQAASARVSGNLAGNPGTRGWTVETFWMPLRYVRIGAQFTLYTRFNGASDNYDGFGRNARDNDTLFLYAWWSY